MRIVLQRVSQASVKVVDQEGPTNSSFATQAIGMGYMLLVGVRDTDGQAEIDWMVHKISNLRIFEDDDGKINRSIRDVDGEILSISQFTLYANVRKGNRPSFIEAGKPNHANEVWESFNQALEGQGFPVKRGRFGAHMLVDLHNDGPMTIYMDTAEFLPHK